MFIERLFEHDLLQYYKYKVFLPNPEWLTEKDKHIARFLINEFWHKTFVGRDLLTKVFPEKRHRYTGFTSLCEPSSVTDYHRFGHFPGKSKTRHTQEVINLWLKEPTLPKLTLQMYGSDIQIPEWVNYNNIRLFMGFLNEKDLRSEYLMHGIHICLSQMEGFGHYINEARSMGALIITLDAPPMNELVDASSGILVPVSRHLSHNHGLRFIATQEAIKEGIQRALKMSLDERLKLGLRVKDRFIEERADFIQNIKTFIDQ